MQKVRNYGPSLILLATIVMALAVGPHMIRQLAFAEQQGRIEEAQQRLKSSPLVELNEAFRSIARAVEPSVAHISMRRKVDPQRRGRSNPFGDEEMLRRFEERFPEFRDRFRRPQEPEQEQEQERNRDREDYNQYNVPREVGNGSGWVYEHASGKKYIITNYHVVEGADELVVKFFDKTTAKATIVGTPDPKTDIAVLQVDHSKQLHPAKLATQPVQQGEIVFAFGSPLQFAFSMSQGIVSGDGRRLGILDQYDRQGRLIASGYENFIQTDAAINPGNSGGPLTNVYGEVVGMNSAMASSTGGSDGLGFAIPVDMIRQIVTQIIEKGVVSRGYMGVKITELDPKLAESFGFKGQGVLVDDLPDDQSPAKAAGMRPGDIVLSVEGRPTDSVSVLRQVVAGYPPGQTVKIKAFRDGKEMMFDVKLAQMPEEDKPLARRGKDEPEPDAPIESKTLKKLGIERLSTLTKEQAEQAGFEFTPGVLIEEVRPNSVAANEGLAPGMIITHVQEAQVKTLEQFTEQIGKADLTRGARLRIHDPQSRSSSFRVLALPQ